MKPSALISLALIWAGLQVLLDCPSLHGPDPDLIVIHCSQQAWYALQR